MRYAKSLVASLVAYATIIALYVTLNYQDTLNLDVRLLAPSLDHPFGTDMLGRDVLQRVLFGFFPTFFVAITATICSLLLAAFLNVGKANAQEPFIGEIRMFAGTFAPRGLAFCDGSIISIAQNSALFSLLGTT